MTDETNPTAPHPPNAAEHDASRDAARDSSSLDDDTRLDTENQRWKDDLEADQMERLFGHEAIEDDEVSADDLIRGDMADL